MTRSTSGAAGIAAAACILVLAAGCSSASDKEGETNSAADPAVALKGAPVNLGVLSPVTGANATPAFQDGVKAALAYVNATGGIKGRPLKATYCDDQGQDPSKNAACVRSFVAKKVVAILSYGASIGTSLPIATSAGLTVVTPGSSAPELSAKNTVILHSAASSGFAALFKYAKEKASAKSISSMIINVPEILSPFSTLLEGTAKASGLSFERVVPVDPSASDYSPAVLRAAQGADLITMSYGPAAMAETVKAAKRVGLNVRFAGSNTLIDEANFLKPAGADADGTLAYSGVVPYTSDDKETTTFRDQMKKAGVEESTGGLSELGFSYLMTSANALKKMGTISASAFGEYFRSNPVPVYLGQTYDASKTPIAATPAVHVTATRIVEVKDGKFDDVGGGWVDPYKS